MENNPNSKRKNKTSNTRMGIFLLIALIIVVTAGCSDEGEGQKYYLWNKLADGAYVPVEVPTDVSKSSVYVEQELSTGDRGMIYRIAEESKDGLISYSLEKSEFDLREIIDNAKEGFAQRGGDPQTIRNFSFNSVRKEIVFYTWKEIWMYHIETKELTCITDGTYEGKTAESMLEEKIKIAEQRQIEGFDFYFCDNVQFSPDGSQMAYISNKDVADIFSNSIFVYDFEKGEETRLLSGKNERFNSIYGWIDEQNLLYEHYDEETEKIICFALSANGEKKMIDTPGDRGHIQGEVKQGTALYFRSDQPEEKTLTALEVIGAGVTKQLRKYVIPDGGSIAIGPVLSSDGKWMSYLCRGADDENAPDYRFHVVELKEEGIDRIIEPPMLGEGIETEISDSYWIDENRVIVHLRENWKEQETVSTWIIDLRGEENGSSIQGVHRDDTIMANAYMTLVDFIYEKDPGLNGKEGELKYIAINTSDMGWINEEQKKTLFKQIQGKYQVEVLEKTYDELKEGEYLQMTEDSEGGYFADGLMIKISGGYFVNNIMHLDEVVKWRGGTEGVGVKNVKLRFQNEVWDVIEEGASWIS